MRLLLCRHGETHANVAGLVQGQSNPVPALTERGRAQAKALGQRLREERLEAVMCSDLLRARETLALVLSALGQPAPPPTYTPLLRERAAGQAEGRRRADYDLERAAAASAAGVAVDQLVEEGAETFPELLARADAFLALLSSRGVSETVLAISHGGFIRAILAACGVGRVAAVENCAALELVSSRSKAGGWRWELRRHETSHLPDSSLFADAG